MRRKSLLLVVLVAIALTLSNLLGNRFVLPVFAQSPYDIVILNGRVMDPETNFDGIRNVGIKDGLIATITEDDIAGAKTIDATDHVVAPGFIDTHFHWTRPIGYKLALRDGVTTAMDLEYGTLGSLVAQWYADREGNTQVNFGTSSGHEVVRSKILDGQFGEVGDAPDALQARGPNNKWATEKLTLEQGNEVLSVIDAGLQAGAIGIGSNLGYMRDGVTAREMLEVQRVGANYGRQTAVHLRNTPGTSTSEPNGVQEVLNNATILNAPALICHFNNPGWEMIQELLVGMRAQGHNVWGEIYPYAAGSTTINAVFLAPEIWVEQLGNRYEDTMLDPATNTFYTEETYKAQLAKDPTTLIVLYKSPEEDIPKWLSLPGVSMGSDAMAIPGDWDWDMPYDELPNTHPRTAGGHAATLRIGRENNVPLMQAIAQLSYNSAKPLGDMGLEAMQVRGRMQEGMVADITIFDPVNVQDHSTYTQGALPSTGIPYVIVNGTLVVNESQVLKDVNPGQPIRFEPEAEGRFKPLELGQWTEEFLIAPIEFGGLDQVTPE